jgi:HlyD family secretion protein
VKKLFLLLVLVAVVLAAVAYSVSNPWWETYLGSKGETPKMETALPVEYGTLIETVSATGAMHPRESLVISTELSGKVVNLLRDINEVVEEGDELLQLDDSVSRQKLVQAESAIGTAEALVKQAESAVAEAEAKRKAAQTTNDRAHEQWQKGNITQSLLDQAQAMLDAASKGIETAKAAVATANAKVLEAKAARDLAQLAVDLTHIRVPFVEHAVVAGAAARAEDVGNIVPANAVTRPKRKYTILERKVVLNQLIGPPQSGQLFTLVPDPRKMELHAQVAEADIGKVAREQSVFFTVSAYENEFFTGKVTEIRQVPTSVNGAIYYTVLVAVDNRAGKDGLALRPGMTTTAVDIVTRQVPDPTASEKAWPTSEKAWLVPNAALDFPLDKQYWHPDVKEKPKAEPGWRVVWYLDDKTGTARYTFIKEGASGKVKDARSGLRNDLYTQVEEWDPKLMPPLSPNAPADLKVITGAEPPKKKGLSVPSIIKS